MAELFAFGGNTIAMPVTAASSRIALPSSTGNVLRIFNAGSDVVFVATGGDQSSAVIPTDGSPAQGFPIAPGGETGISIVGGQTHIAAITASGTATLYLTRGAGI